MTHTIPAQPESMTTMQLTDQIDYRPEKFNNKVLFREEDFNIILFALLQDQEIPAHKTPRNAYLQCLEGEVAVSIGGVTYALKKGGIIQLPKEIMHGMKAILNSKLLLMK